VRNLANLAYDTAIFRISQPAVHSYDSTGYGAQASTETYDDRLEFDYLETQVFQQDY
jgi:hypothetical protein